MFTTSLRTVGAVAAAAVLSLGLTSGAHADDETTTDVPCAAQEAKVAKAEAALARVAAVHASHANKGNAKAKKAQQQRLAKAKARLATCAAAQPM